MATGFTAVRGVFTFLSGLSAMCKAYRRYKGNIVAAINTLPSSVSTTALPALAALDSVCELLQALDPLFKAV